MLRDGAIHNLLVKTAGHCWWNEIGRSWRHQARSDSHREGRSTSLSTMNIRFDKLEIGIRLTPMHYPHNLFPDELIIELSRTT